MKIWPFPTERQLDSKDCGATCIKIIAKYYGKFYSLQYLRDKSGTRREGVSVADLSYTAESIGLRTLAFHCTITELEDKVPFPCIVHWRNSHFIVVYKIRKGKVYASDPARGLVSYTFEQFEKHWYQRDESKGAVVALEPMADFEERDEGQKRDRKRTLSNIFSYFKPYRRSFINLGVVMLLVTILQGILPFIAKAVIDVGIQTKDLKFINVVLIANICIVISIMLSNAVRNWILLHVTSRINIAIISDYLIKLMKLPITFFENKLVGDILQRANDHERIRSFIMNNGLNMIFSTMTFVVFGIILSIYNTAIFLIFLFGSIIYILWTLAFIRIRKKLDWEYFDLVSKDQSYWVETISGMQDIKINNYETAKRWKWEKNQVKLHRVNTRVLSITDTQNLGAQFIDTLKNLCITFYCAKAVIAGEITFGVMISTQFIIGMLNGPVIQFIQFIISAQFAQISFLRLNEIHQLKEEEDETVNNSIELPSKKTIVLKNVSFQYSPNSPLTIKNLTMVIPEGKVTAIVGDSGSGKTTLLKLLLRLYEPTYGEISVGGMNIVNVSLKQWRERCGAVMQDGKIFNDTILNNIILGDEHVNYELLRHAVETANIAHEIESLPSGYQTVMGELGRGLSGGQKQRILIARALYKNPDYLFFDEATNSLDAINEQKIVNSLEHVFQGKTVIIIAHRLSTIRKADQIIVLRDGQIMEVGNHESLVKREGRYYELISTQSEILRAN
jgi:ATP-binding cassette subfamily B protein